MGCATDCPASLVVGVVGAAEPSGVLGDPGAVGSGAASVAGVLGAAEGGGASVVVGTVDVRALAEPVLTPSVDVHAAATRMRAPAAAVRARRHPRDDMARMVLEVSVELPS
jgi:hypothetical protein